jgi:hypothetical protein
VGNTNEHRQHPQGPTSQAELKVTAAGGIYAGCFRKHFPQHGTVSFRSCIKTDSYFLLCVLVLMSRQVSMKLCMNVMLLCSSHTSYCPVLYKNWYMANKDTSETGTMRTPLDVDFWHGVVRAAPKL